MIKFVLGLLLFISFTAHAEVYRWTDANGKVHYSDKKPKAAAEDITDKVKTTNIDTSTTEHQKLEAVFRKENDADREFKERQAQPNPELLKWCADAKIYLKKISGRVQFLDENNQPVHITEAERKQKAEKMQKTIKEQCPAG